MCECVFVRACMRMCVSYDPSFPIYIVCTSPLYDEQSHRSYFEQVCLEILIPSQLFHLLCPVYMQCFEVVEKLGEGSFGEVSKGIQLSSEIP